MPSSDTMLLLVTSSVRRLRSTGMPSSRAMRLLERFRSLNESPHARSIGSTSMRLSRHPCTHSDLRLVNRAMPTICDSDCNRPP